MHSINSLLYGLQSPLRQLSVSLGYINKIDLTWIEKCINVTIFSSFKDQKLPLCFESMSQIPAVQICSTSQKASCKAVLTSSVFSEQSRLCHFWEEFAQSQLPAAFSSICLIKGNLTSHRINVPCLSSVSGWQDRHNTTLTKWPLSAVINEFHSREN